jgi:hypothetical protein
LEKKSRQRFYSSPPPNHDFFPKPLKKFEI